MLRKYWRTCDFVHYVHVIVLARPRQRLIESIAAPLPLKLQSRYFSYFGESVTASAVIAVQKEDALEANTPLASIDKNAVLQRLEDALEAKDGEIAWKALQKLKRMRVEFPEKVFIKDFLDLMVTKTNDPQGLYRAYKLICRLNTEEKMGYLDRGLLGSFGFAFAKASMFDLSANMIRLMILHKHYPSLDVWKDIMEFWVQKPHGAVYAIRVFLEICTHVTKGPSAKDLRIQVMKPDAEAFNVALRACGLLQEYDRAEEIVSIMCRFKVKPDNGSFVSLIKAYEGTGSSLKRMRKVWLLMKKAQVTPDSISMYTLFTACLNLDDIEAAAQILLSWSRKAGNNSDGACQEKLMIFKNEGKPEIVELTDLIRKWNEDLSDPSEEAYALLLQAFLKKGRVTDAVLFLQCLCHGHESSGLHCSFAFTHMIQIGSRDEVYNILKALEAQNTPADSVSYGMLTKAYCKLPQPIKGQAVLEDARKAGQPLDATCYDALINAYDLLQDYENACVAFKLMRDHGVEPIEPTFMRLFSSWEKIANPKFMFRLLKIAGSWAPSLHVNAQLCNRAIRAFAKEKQMVHAKGVVRWMKVKEIPPTATTYKFLLNGYIYRRGRTSEILLLWEEVKQALKSDKDMLNKAIASLFLMEFVSKGHFKKAMDVMSYVEDRNLWVDKESTKDEYKYLQRDIYGSEQKKIDVKLSSAQKRQINAFKLWAGLGPA